MILLGDWARIAVYLLSRPRQALKQLVTSGSTVIKQEVTSANPHLPFSSVLSPGHQAKKWYPPPTKVHLPRLNLIWIISQVHP